MAPQPPSPVTSAHEDHLFDRQLLIDLRAYLMGCWSLNREIVGVTTMQGRCTFSAHKDGLMQAEAVRYRMPTSGLLEGFSWYFWEFPEAGSAQLYRTTSTGEPRTPFLRLRLIPGPSGAQAADIHVCDPDTYRTTFQLLSPSEFLTTYDVAGPCKGYTSIATYRRE